MQHYTRRRPPNTQSQLYFLPKKLQIKTQNDSYLKVRPGAVYLRPSWFRCLSFVRTWLTVTRNKIKGRQREKATRRTTRRPAGPAAATAPTKWQNALPSERVTEETSVLTARISVLRAAVKASELVSAAVTVWRVSQYTAESEGRERTRWGGRGNEQQKQTRSTNTSGITRTSLTTHRAIMLPVTH